MQIYAKKLTKNCNNKSPNFQGKPWVQQTSCILLGKPR